MTKKLKILFREVHSKHIVKVGHLDDSLYVCFKNNSCYRYFPVDRNRYLKLISANSVGAYFHKHIVKNKKIKHVTHKLDG